MIFIRFFILIGLALSLVGCVSASHHEAPPPPSQDHAEHLAPSTPPQGQQPSRKLIPYVIDLQAQSTLAKNKPAQFSLKILNQAGKSVSHQQFRVMHGRRVHALIIDPSLTDYQHIHLKPETDNGPAVYTLALTPTQSGPYQIYLDVVDQQNRHYFLESGFTVPGAPQATVFDKNLQKGSIQNVVEVQGLTFNMQTDAPIRAKQHVMLNITVKQGDALFRKLEPVMQAYGHLVGFNADRSELIHTHPMGEEPRSSNQRGGPNLNFGLQFPEPGYYRLFLQVQVDGKDIFVPIDARVI